jgi:hypothetical protein
MNSLQLPAEERRQYVRFGLTREASFEHERGLVTGHLIDISFFGALFEMDGDNSLGSKSGVLLVPYSRDPEEAVRVNAKLVYRRDRSIGLSWQSLDPEHIVKVRRLVEMNQGQPWLLMRPAHALFWAR